MSSKHLMCLLLGGLSLPAVLSSCSEDSDDPEYQSVIPEFSDMTFEVLGESRDRIHVGDQIVAKAVQKKRGRLLDRTTYSWTSSQEDLVHRYTQQNVYDADKSDPTDTLTVTQAGRIRLTMTAKYQVSGQYKNYNRTEEIEDGNVTYRTLSWQFYEVTVTKYFRVYASAASSE